MLMKLTLGEQNKGWNRKGKIDRDCERKKERNREPERLEYEKEIEKATELANFSIIWRKQGVERKGEEKQKEENFTHKETLRVQK